LRIYLRTAAICVATLLSATNTRAKVQLDDLAILALGIKIFIELSPKAIVREYRGEWASTASTGPTEPTDTGETVDAEYRVVK